MSDARRSERLRTANRRTSSSHNALCRSDVLGQVGSPFGHRCSESLDIHQAEAGDERDRIVFHV